MLSEGSAPTYEELESLVLILVLLEVAFGVRSQLLGWNFTRIHVLILVLLEVAFGDKQLLTLVGSSDVLILVLLEVAFGVAQKTTN